MRKNRLVAIWGVVILGGWVVLSSVETAHGYQGSAKARLAKKGIRATRSGFSLLEESEFSKSVAAAYSLKRKFAAATHPHQSAGSSNEEAEGQVEAPRSKTNCSGISCRRSTQMVLRLAKSSGRSTSRSPPTRKKSHLSSKR